MTKTPQLGLPPPCLLTAAASELFWVQLGSPPLGQHCHVVSRPHVPLSQCAALYLFPWAEAQGVGQMPASFSGLVLYSFGPAKNNFYFRFSFLVSTFPLSDPPQPGSQTFPETLLWTLDPQLQRALKPSRTVQELWSLCLPFKLSDPGVSLLPGFSPSPLNNCGRNFCGGDFSRSPGILLLAQLSVIVSSPYPWPPRPFPTSECSHHLSFC